MPARSPALESATRVDLYRPSPYEIIPRARGRINRLHLRSRLLRSPASLSDASRWTGECTHACVRTCVRARARGCTSRGTSVSSVANAAWLQGTCSRSNVDVGEELQEGRDEKRGEEGGGGQTRRAAFSTRAAIDTVARQWRVSSVLFPSRDFVAVR
jgi:hypothetical protein